MATKLKIGADVREIRRAIMDLSRELDSKMSKKLGLFDADTKKILSNETTRQIREAKDNIKRLQEEAKRYAEAMKSSAKSSKEELDARKNLLSTMRTLKREASDLSKLQEAGGGGFMGGVGRALGRSSVGRFMGGAGLMGMTGMGVGAGLLAAGGYAVNRGMEAYQTYSGGVDSRQRLRGRGISNVFDTSEELGNLGYSPEDVRQGRLQASDLFGSRNASVSDFANTARFSKAFGLDSQQVQGSMMGLRGTLGRGGAGENFDLLKKHAALIGESMEDAVGTYLETAADMLTEMNQNGMPMSDDVMNLFTSLTKGGAPIERVARQISTAQNAVQGATGEANAFFQRAFGSQGIGGGRVGMTQMAMQTSGLFGFGKEQGKAAGLTDEQMKAFERLGIMGEGTGFKERATGIVDTMKRMFPDTDTGMAAKGRFAQGMFGTQNAPEALGILNRLEKAIQEQDSGSLAKIKKELEDQKKGPQEKMAEHLKNIQSSVDGQLERLTSMRKLQEETLGQAIAPAINSIQEKILNIDANITAAVAKFLGVETPQMRADDALKGKANLGRGEIENLMTVDPAKAKNMVPALEQRIGSVQAQIQKMSKPGLGGDVEVSILKEELRNMIDTLNTVKGVLKKGFKDIKPQRGPQPSNPGGTRG